MSSGNGKELPEGWSEATLGDVAEYINGAAFKPTDWTPDGTPIIRIQNLTDPTKQPNRTRRKVDPRLLIHDGDLLFSWSATLDAFVWHGEDAWLNQHIFKVVPEPPLATCFVFYLLRFAVREITRSEHMHGSTMQHINRGPFLTHRIGFPPFAEQQRIADKLDELLSDLDAGVAALEGVRAKLKHYRAAVLKAAVEGSLTAAWRAQHPAAEPASTLLTRILAERRRRWEEAQLQKFQQAGKTPPKNWQAKYREPTAPDPAHLPKLPEGWCWTSVDQVGQIQGGLQKTPGRTPVKNHYPYLRVANVLRGRLDLDEIHRFELAESELERLRLEGGDLLIVEGNGSRTEIGRSALWRGEIADCVHQNHIIRVRPLPGIDPDYLDQFFNSPIGQLAIQLVASSTSGLYTLSVGKIEKLPLALPPLAEQTAIVELVEDQLSVIDHLESDLEAKLKSAQALRQSILRDAFAGKLVPQDPNDEPASELLKRIATEREQRERAARAAKGRATKRRDRPSTGSTYRSRHT